MFLHWKNLKEYGAQWNKTAIAFNEFFELHMRPQVLAASDRLPPKIAENVAFLKDVRNSIRGAYMECEFRHLNPPVHFYQHIFKVYQAGHYPCGWVMPWPDGTLLVYWHGRSQDVLPERSCL